MRADYGSNSEADAGAFERLSGGDSPLGDSYDAANEEHWIPPAAMIRLPPGVTAADYFGD